MEELTVTSEINSEKISLKLLKEFYKKPVNACKKREFFEKKIQKNEKIVVRASDTSCFLQEHLKEIPYISKKIPKECPIEL